MWCEMIWKHLQWYSKRLHSICFTTSPLQDDQQNAIHEFHSKKESSEANPRTAKDNPFRMIFVAWIIDLISVSDSWFSWTIWMVVLVHHPTNRRDIYHTWYDGVIAFYFFDHIIMQIKTFQPTNHKIKAVVYGASGTWKTVFWWTAPKPIFASAEGWLLSIAGKNPAFVEIKSLKDLQELLDYLQKQPHDYETVIIDSITEINDIIKVDIEKRTGRSMQLADWWELSKKIRGVLRGFRDLPMHTLFIAQESMDKDEDKVTKIVPSLNWKAATEIAYFMDVVWYLFIDKAGERKMITAPNEKLLTKDRTSLIWNDTPVDFGVWVEKVKWIKTGEQTVLAEHNKQAKVADDEEEDDKPKKSASKKSETLPEAPKKTEPVDQMDEDTRKQLFANWNDLWKLYLEKMPFDRDEAGFLKFAPHTEELVRKSTIQQLYDVDSVTKMSKEQAKDFIQKMKKKCSVLSDLDTPFWTPEQIQAEWDADKTARSK